MLNTLSSDRNLTGLPFGAMLFPQAVYIQMKVTSERVQEENEDLLTIHDPRIVDSNYIYSLHA